MKKSLNEKFPCDTETRGCLKLVYFILRNQKEKMITVKKIQVMRAACMIIIIQTLHDSRLRLNTQ